MTAAMCNLTKILNLCDTAYQMTGRLSLVSKVGEPYMDMTIDMLF